MYDPDLRSPRVERLKCAEKFAVDLSTFSYEQQGVKLTASFQLHQEAKKMKAFVTLSILVISISPAIAQKRVSPKPAQSPISIQTATTKDGRTVLLKSDGTWEYTNDAPIASTAPATSEVTALPLSVEAALVFRSGDVKPMARVTFYLLDEDLAKILRDAGLKIPREFEVLSGGADHKLLLSFGSAWSYPSLRDNADFNATANEAMKAHVRQTVTTDFSGKGTFQGVASGNYFVVGIGKTPRGFALWNVPVTVKVGAVNSITLDQNNAAFAS